MIPSRPVASRTVGVLAALVASSACSPDSGPATTDPAPVVQAAWWRQLATEPEAFSEIVANRKAGWVALHRHDHAAAHQALVSSTSTTDRAGAARAALGEALLHGDLARLVDHANRERQAALLDRGAPSGALGPAIAAWGAGCSPAKGGPLPVEGDLAAWFAEHTPKPVDAYPGHPPPSPSPPMPANTPDALRDHVSLHRRVLSGDAEAMKDLYSTAGRPVATEAAEGFERTHVDPCIDATLSAAWSLRARDVVGGPGGSLGELADALDAAGLAGSLFAPWPSVADIPLGERDRPLWGTEYAEFWALPNGLSLPLDGDLQSTRDAAAAVSAWADQEAAAAAAASVGEGSSLLAGLSPVAGYRQGVLVAAARDALLLGRPQQALVLLETAHDVTHREVGATNAPHLFVLLAEARLRTGRTRQALDALAPLTARVPTVHSAQELVGDLAVLQSIDRIGDSKESP